MIDNVLNLSKRNGGISYYMASTLSVHVFSTNPFLFKDYIVIVFV